MSSWVPTMSTAQADEILCSQGLLEVETQVIDGQVQRVWKNQWPSVRSFFLFAVSQFENKPYIAFEGKRWTFKEIESAAARFASIFRDVYGVRKGDRVAICCRNYPEFIISFWACHLLGSVSALINAFLPVEPMRHSIVLTDAKLVIVDPERANLFEPIMSTFAKQTPGTKFAVIASHEGKGRWNGMDVWTEVESRYGGDTSKVLEQDPGLGYEDNATIIFTSGTTGLPKGVLSTQRMFMNVVMNAAASSVRAMLRRGEVPPAEPEDRKAILVPTPFFHVTGTTLLLLASLFGAKLVLMRKWNPKEAVKIIKAEDVGAVGGVPSLIHDLADGSFDVSSLDTIMYGGGPSNDTFLDAAKKRFPNATMSQAYGLTESNATVVSFSGEDCFAHPTSCGLALPCNDIMIMDPTTEIRLPPGEIGEVWIRGPGVMKGYWRDKEATDKTLTRDGWLKSGDLGYMDEEGYLYIKDRQKDIIIRGGENVDSVSVENALYAHPGIAQAAAVGVPDPRLGELVTAVVRLKPQYEGQVSEEALIALAKQKLPKFAVPVMVIISNDPFPQTPSGKIIKVNLRQLAKTVWAQKQPANSKL